MDIINPYIHGGEALTFNGFGNRSRSFDGVDDYVSIPDFEHSLTNLSCMCWIKSTDSNYKSFFSHWDDNSNRSWLIQLDGTNGLLCAVRGTAASAYKIYFAPDAQDTIADGTWHHIGFTFSNNDLRLYIDGLRVPDVRVNKGFGNAAITSIKNSTSNILIGADIASSVPANFVNANIADCRIYDATLTEAEMTDIYNGTNITTNLVGQWLTDADNLLDAAGTNHGTNYGTKYSYDNPSPPVEFGSASRSFDGVSDHVNLGNSTEFSFSDGNNDEPFSLSTWLKMDDNSTFRILSKDNGIGSDREWLLATDSGGNLNIYLIDGGQFRGREYTTPLPENEWLHISATYDGSGGENFRLGLKLYVNGVKVDNVDLGSGGYVAMDVSTANNVYIGRYATSYADGKFADVRIYDDELTASEVLDLYNGNNHTDNLIGHWLTDNDDVEDKAGTNDGTNFGSTYSYDNPPMDLVPSRQASRSFDGSSDYVDLGDVLDDVFAGTGKQFTVAAWIKTTTLENTDFFSKYLSTGNQRSFLCRVLSDGNLAVVMIGDGAFGTNRFGRQTDTAPISANTWHHVAITYDQTATGDYLRMWVDGTEDATLTDWLSNGTFTSIYDGTAKVRISGIHGGVNENWEGNIADVRIYDTDLTATDISDIYNGTTDRTNLVGQWLTNSDDVLDHAGTNDGTNFGSIYSTDSPS